MSKMAKTVLIVAGIFTVLLMLLWVSLNKEIASPSPESTVGGAIFKSAIFLMMAGITGGWMSKKGFNHFLTNTGFGLFVLAVLLLIWAEPSKQMPNLKKTIDVKMPNMSGIFSWEVEKKIYTPMKVETKGDFGSGGCDAHIDEVFLDGISTDYLSDEQSKLVEIYGSYGTTQMNQNFRIFKRSSFNTSCSSDLKLWVPQEMLGRIKIVATLISHNH